MASNLVLGVTLASLFVLMATNGNAQQTFGFTGFGPAAQNLILQGDATFLSNGVLALATHQNAIGRALYDTPITIWDATTGTVASFVTSFCFDVQNIPGFTPADGLSFFLTPNFNIPPNSQPWDLSYGPPGNNFVAVEFDTFFNSIVFDPPSPHIGVDLNSVISLKTVPWNKVSGAVVQVTIIYDSLTKTLRVALVDKNAAITTIDQLIDLKAVLPSKVFVGLSASTGLGVELHNFHSWSFTSSFDPTSTVIDTTNIPSYACNV